jgi:hypothetical protein
MVRESDCDILVVGGSVGGCAAALGAAALGKRVILTEESDWLGGQLTSQAVPPDEHPWIEQFGCTRRYRAFREGVRAYYRDHYPLSPVARQEPYLNPGQGYVSRLCHEPRVALAVIEGMMAAARAAGRLQVRTWRRPVAAEADGDRVRAVHLRNLESGQEEIVQASYVLDATELGDLLPLAGVEYVSGAEAQSETGEPHAASQVQPENVQSITWCFPMAYDPQAEHFIEKPAQYARWRAYVPRLQPAWPGRLLDWTHPDPVRLEARTRTLFPPGEGRQAESLWCYRRISCRDTFLPGSMPHEATLVNWPQNDYWEGNIIDQSAEAVAHYLEEARQLSLSLLYWLQTEAPRPDGGQGYPGLYLRPDMTGTADGLAKTPYIREARRIRAVFTVTEEHVGAAARGTGEAARFADSVGVGCYRIDLHPSTGGDNYIDISSLPFQIPLGALIPLRMENLLPACKNLGVTHITNGCFRLHPVEWNIGEAAGLLSAFCLEKGLLPRQVHAQADRLAEFQSLLRGQGVELEWPQVHAV